VQVHDEVDDLIVVLLVIVIVIGWDGMDTIDFCELQVDG
jgi:hypothetical protein